MTGSALPRVTLHPGHDRRVARGYPWAFSNEIRMDPPTKALPRGTLATLHRVDGKPLGVGSFNPHALIAFRVFDRDPARPIDEGFFAERLRRALRLRQRLFDEPFYRLVHAEADGAPGLICDRYGDVAVVQLNTAGADGLRDPILAALDAVLAPRAIVLRNDAGGRADEGLPQETAVAKGSIAGPIECREGGLSFSIDVLGGQKTGWFFDQRDNRAATARLAAGGAMLDLYCHLGGFAITAARAGAASCLGVDSSESALALARESAERNGVADRCVFRRAEVFAELERMAGESARFRVVACDPPAFVKSRKDLNAGLRGYRKLARLAAALVEAEGFLFVASCSHNVTPDALIAEVGRGVEAAGRSGALLGVTGAAPDHPMALQLPETAYLKAALLRLD